MEKYMFNRVIKEGEYLLNTDKTIREVASDFKISKSTS